jgi:Na+/melibiose symporter-like transporter
MSDTKGYLSTFTKLAYGIGDFGFSCTDTASGILFAIFLVDVIGLAPRLAALAGGCGDIGCSYVDLGDHSRCCGGGRISGRCAPRGNVLCSGFSFQKDRLFDFIPLTLLVLDWSGVASNAPQQSVSAVWAIRILIGPASSVLLLAGIAFAIYYPLSRESHAETREKITAHRKAPAD